MTKVAAMAKRHLPNVLTVVLYRRGPDL